MEKSSERLVNLANKRFSEILSDGFKLFSKNYKTLILPLALFQVILIILNIFLLTDLNLYNNSLAISAADILEKFAEGIEVTASEWDVLISYLFLTVAFLFLQNLIGAIIITIAMCSVSNYIFKKQMNRDTNFTQSFKSAYNKKMLLPLLIIGICIPLGSLLIFLFIPAIILFGFFIFLIFTYNIEDIQNPISEARAIAKGSFWKIIGVFIINFLIIWIISLIYNLIIDFIIDTNVNNFSSIYNSWLDPDTRNYGMIILYNVLTNLIDIILAPLFICLLTSLFSSSKAKKELGIQYQVRYYPVKEVYQESYQQPIQKSQEINEPGQPITPSKLQVEGRFYCPFCGYLIEKPKKFCPNCGERLSFIDKES